MSMEKHLPCNPEVWGGIECTINRVGDTFTDQLASAGHYTRESDIDRVAALGIKALRYPVLWERHQPLREQPIDWTWTARQLDSIRDHNIIPIAGLLHHGSGPAFTNLASPSFAEEFACYAGQVAARFPWLEYYTPINEPLTTARFSGLYGLWYPHRRDPLLCIKMLLNQVKGIVYAMKAIRQINPAAKLIQTEDLGKVYSSPGLLYQRDFENHRRWLTFDLLMGRVNRQHPLWDYLLSIGIEESQLIPFTENPCIPDLIGINYYVTSERFLDEDISRYPADSHGGNGLDIYVDTEAVRVITPGGLSNLLQEVWHRYHLPLSITEAHLNCTREEQLRWLKEIWDIACQAKKKGIDIKAVTAWALLGATDWDSLITRKDGHYEEGAYEVTPFSKLRLTGIGRLIKMLADSGACDHPLLQEPGWWHRQGPGKQSTAAYPSRQLLLIGKDEPSNQRIADICHGRGIACIVRLYQDDQPFAPAAIAEDIDPDQVWGVVVTSWELSTGALVSYITETKGIPAVCLQANRLTGFSKIRLDKAFDRFIDQAMEYIDQEISVEYE